jgi:hypothetical protein
MRIDIEPFNEVFFVNCGYQALLAATRFHAGTCFPIIANSCGKYSCSPVGGAMEFTVDHVNFMKESTLLDWLGIVLEEHGYLEELEEAVVRAIELGRPSIVDVDWSVVKSTPFFGKSARPHSVLLHGYDRTVKEFSVIGNATAQPLNYARHSLPVEEIAGGYNAFNSKFNADGSKKSYCLISFVRQPIFGEVQAVELCRTLLGQTILRYGSSNLSTIECLRDTIWQSLHVDGISMAINQGLTFVQSAMKSRLVDEYKLYRFIQDENALRSAKAVVGALRLVLDILLKMEITKSAGPRVGARLRHAIDAWFEAEKWFNAQVALSS